MAKIHELDKNFAVEANATREGMVFYDIKDEPFRIYGVFHDGKLFRRMPESVTAKVSVPVESLSRNTAGGRVRFITDSPYIIVKAILPLTDTFRHLPGTNMCGFDIYVEHDGVENYEKTIVPPLKFENSYAGACDFQNEFLGGSRERLVTVNFPCYGEVHELYIGIKDGSALKTAPDYEIEKPIVYYGSSITQGGCAMRPGTTYQAHVSRRYGADYINLGFSGNGKGEIAAAEYIASLDMSAFVLDYDHNAPTNEHYQKTHEPFFKTVRAAHPDIPIILMTRPKIRLTESELERIDIAKATYVNAVAAGDRKVAFIDGRELMAECGYEGTVDRCHPNDLGFYSMAKRLFLELDKFFKPLK